MRQKDLLVRILVSNPEHRVGDCNYGSSAVIMPNISRFCYDLLRYFSFTCFINGASIVLSVAKGNFCYLGSWTKSV